MNAQKLFFIVLVCLLIPGGLAAQTQISGVVTEAGTGEGLAGASVSVEGSEIGVITDRKGHYSLSIPEGMGPKVTIVVELMGFKRASITLTVEKDQSLTQNFTLEIDVVKAEVTVTARKVEEDLQDIPIAATAITSDDIVNRSVSNLLDAFSTIPNVVVEANTTDGPNIVIRGIGSSGNNVGLESAIGVYVDEVYLARPAAFNSTLMDIERIEVLRGTQGTLFGKNTIGGIINIVTSKPGPRQKAAFDVSYGSFNLVQVRGFVNTVLVPDKLFAKITGTYKDRNGWMENRFPGGTDVQSERFYGVRGQFLYFPSESVEFLLSVDYSRDNNIQNGQEIAGGPLYALDGFNEWDRSIATNPGDSYERNLYGVSLRATAYLGSHTLNSITAYRGFESEFFNDQDYTLLELVATGRRETLDFFSQELRIASSGDQPFSYLAGLYYLNQTTFGRDQAFLFEEIPPLFGAPFIPGYEESVFVTSDIKAQSYAAFLSGTYTLSDQFSIQGGLRYTYEKKDFTYFQEVTPFFIVPGFPETIVGIAYALAADVPETFRKYSDGAISGDISLNYKVTQDVLVYGKYTRGFKAGGFNTTLSASSDPGDLEYDPEYVNSFELGFKSTLAGGRLRINAAAFYLKYKDKQEQIMTPAIEFIASNAGEVSSKGFELEVTALPVEGLDITASLGYTDAKYDEFKPSPFEDFSGNRAITTPRWTGFFAPQYSFNISSALRAFIRGEIRYRSESFTDAVNDPRFISVANTVVNGRIGFETTNRRYSVYVWGKNLTGVDYLLFGWEGFGAVHVGVNAPRMAGVEVRFNF